MDFIPFSIKINQTNQTESWKSKGNTQTIPPPLNSFNQIFHNLHKSPSSSEQKNMDNLKNTSTQENIIKNIDTMDSVKLKLSALITSLTARIQETEKQQDPTSVVLTTDHVSQFEPTDASISLNSIQHGTDDSSIDLSLFLKVLKDMENGEAIETTKLLKQAFELIKKLPLEEKQKWLEGIEFTNFQGINQQQPLKDLIINRINDIPDHNRAEDLKFTVEHGSPRNQTSLSVSKDEQSDLVSQANRGDQASLHDLMEQLKAIPTQENKADNISIMKHREQQSIAAPPRAMVVENRTQPNKISEEKGFQPPPVVHVSRFVPVMISKENQAPVTKVVELQPAFNTFEILANQEMSLPDKINELNIKSKEPPSVVHVSQFVPEVSEWIGEFVKAIPEQSGSTDAKINLQLEHFGPIQIKITGENRKVTVQILTGTNSGKEALQDQINNLKKTLQQQGVLVKKLEIGHQPSVEEQSVVSSAISKKNPTPFRNKAESQPAFNTSEILANQQMHQPDNTNELNIKSKEPPSVVQVSQFVPEVSEWIGEFVKAIPEQSSSTKAKISLQPEHFGPIQIKITRENGKVTAKIVTDTTFARDKLEGQLPLLRQALQQQGILVQKLEITHQPLLVKDLIQAINSPMSNQGFFSAIESRGKPVSPTKTLVKQNIMTSWGSEGNQVILQKTVEEQKVIKARGSGESQTSFPITVEEQITITTQENRVDQIHWSKSEEVLKTAEEKNNHQEQTTMLRMEPKTPLKKAFEEPRILASMNTNEDKSSNSKLVNESSNVSTEEDLEEQIPVTNSTEEQQAFDSSEIIVNQQMHQLDKMIAAKPNVPPPVVPVSQFVPEVSKWIEGTIRTNPEQFGSTEAKFSLNPEKLGPIQIKITTENGKLAAQIITDTIFAKEALEVQLPQLRQSLQQQGILVQKLEIIQQNLQYADFAQSNSSFSQGSSGFSQEQKTYTTQQNGSKKQKDSNKEEIVKEIVFTTYGGRGPRSTQSNIDFTA